jgi:hypothetical protein
MLSKSWSKDLVSASLKDAWLPESVKLELGIIIRHSGAGYLRNPGDFSVSKRSIADAVEPIPPSWRSIAEQHKTFLGWPSWSAPPRLGTGTKGKASPRNLRTTAAETTEAIVQLADASGVGLEGVRLCLVAWAFRMQREVTATLEVPGGRSFVTIARVDAWPDDPHLNVQARKHSALRHLPAIVDGCHVHRFADNSILGRAAFGPVGNLPVAAPLPTRLQSFRDFLRTVAVEFVIEGIEMFDSPDWGELL